jgi:hypothetical protein
MDMYLNLDTRPDGLMAPIMYNPDLLEAATVRRMFADWREILEAGVAHPDRPVSELALSKPAVAGPVAAAPPPKRGFLRGLFGGRT